MRLSDLAAEIATRERIANRTWLELMTSIVIGGIGFAFVRSVQTLVRVPGRIVQDTTAIVGAALADGLNQYVETATTLWARAWSTSVDLGVFQLPYAVLIVVGTFLVSARLISIWRDD